jgi:electron-transferring-flavoprotein dehydrogenase
MPMTEYRAPLRDMKEDQPCDLTLKDATFPIAVDLAKFDAPGRRYCPVDVYEIEREADGTNPRPRINARTARIARPATSKTRLTTSSGSRRRAANPVYPNM